VLMFSSTGTGAMEASISNFMRTGDTIITVNGGKFGERWGLIGRAYGLNVVELNVEWGRSVTVEQVAEALEQNPNTRAVYVQASETSTGVAHPIEAIAKLCQSRPNTLCVVDGITAVGVQPLEMDAWGVDVVVSGSQKSFMLPPGLAFLAASEKAYGHAETANLPKFYFNVLKERKSQSTGTTAWTSAVSLVVGLRRVLDRMNAMTLPGLHKHHDTLARATRAAMTALDMKLLADNPADSVTAVRAPEAIGATPIIAAMNERGIKIAGGQEHLKGKIFRVGHLGWFDGKDIVVTVNALEQVVQSLGHSVTAGAAAAAASTVLGE